MKLYWIQSQVKQFEQFGENSHLGSEIKMMEFG